MAPKSEADHIRFLLAIISHSDAVKWNDVAESTGLYKSGKFVKQAYDGIKKKYAENTEHLSTPKSKKVGGSAKKRRADVHADDTDQPTSSKKSRSKKEVAEQSDDDMGGIKEDTD